MKSLRKHTIVTLALLALSSQYVMAQQSKVHCPATVIGAPGPLITMNPADKTTCIYANEILIAGGTGEAPLTFQWLFNGLLIAGSDDTLFLNNIIPSMIGQYQCIVSNACGSDTSLSANLNLNSIPMAYAGPDKTICQGNNVQIGQSPYASNGSGPYTYFWSSFPSDNSLISNTPDPLVQPTITTTYVLNILDALNCPGYDTAVITVNPFNPVILNAIPDVSGNGCNFNFTGANLKYFWQFGDGTISNLSNPYHLYPAAGLYNACLTVQDSITSCSSENCININIGQTTLMCNAEFNAVDSGNLRMQFNALSPLTFTNCFWSFGDGASALNSTPLHIYDNPGFFTVTLTVIDSVNGCFTVMQKMIQVSSGNVMNDCDADFLFYSSTSNNAVVFADQSVGGIITQHLWNFGDGNTSTSASPTHLYDSTGYYNVCHTIWNQNACSNMKCKTVVAGNSTSVCYPVFNYLVDSAGNKASGYPVDFKGATFGEPARIIWNYGDGTTGDTLLTTQHTYTTSAIFLGELQVTSVSGTDNKAVKLINTKLSNNVLKGMFGYILKSPIAKASGYPVDFKGASFGEPARVIWNFGDGHVDSTTMFPMHSFTDTGLYNVCLTIIDDVNNMSDTYCENIHIMDSTQVSVETITAFDATLAIYPNPVNSKLMIDYRLLSATPITWSLTDATGRSLRNYSNWMQKAGNYHEEWNVCDLQTGIYFLHMRMNNEIRIIKVIKQ